MPDKPDCYACVHRGAVPGSAHSSCRHPSTGADHDNQLGGLSAIFASVGRGGPAIGQAVAELGIDAVAHGVRSGWFNWPWDFDPTWLLTCNGFEAKEVKTDA